MEKKQNGKRTYSFDRLIDRIFRFKLSKRGSRNNMEVRPSIEYKKSETSSQPQDDDYQYEWQYRKISPEDLQPFCDQLGRFLKYVQNIYDLIYLSYDYPSVLQNRLDKDTKELECLFREVKDATISIDRIKAQKAAVKKEKAAVKRIVKKVREDEIREMETIISLYDKTMFVRWENAKNTHKPEILENMLNEIKGKQQAMEYLNTLVIRRLGQLQTYLPLTSTADNTSKERSLSGLTTDSTDEDRPSIANSITVRRHHPHGSGPNTSRNVPFRRRRHHDRQDGHMTNRFITSPIHDGSNVDLPMVPFGQGGSPFQIIGPMLPDGANSNHSLMAASSSSNTVNNNENNSPNGTGSNSVGEFQSEMRTVLQALFGEFRHATPATIAFNHPPPPPEPTDRSNNSSREIELYTLRRPT